MSIADLAERMTAKIDLTDDDGKKKSQATLLIELGSRFELFHDPDRNAYAVDPGDVRRVYPVRSSDFRQRLSGDFFSLTDRGCNGNAVSDALSTIEAKAIHLGPERPVYLRVARVDDDLFVDLADDGWRVVRVTPRGWEVLTRSPVDFIRKPGMAPFPTPTKGGDINRLRDFINVKAEDFPLIVGWVLGAFRGTGEYPVLVLQGEEGTGKSTAGRVLRSLTDPSTVALRAPPKTVDDLLVSACGNHVVALDNLSGINAEMADALCRLSTGGGLDKRRLFTDSEQVLIDLTRPIIVNGIDEIATRSDLSSRSIIVRLPVITAQLGGEEQFRQDFRDELPGIFGAILTGVSSSLARGYLKPHGIKVRMIDFVNWVTRAEPAMGLTQGAFLERFAEMRSRAVADGLEASPVGSTLLEYLMRPGAPREWVVTPTDLFETLTRVAGVRAQSKAWPQSPRGLGNSLTRLAPSLRAVGITFTKEETRDRRYKFYLVAKKAHEAPDAHINPPKSTDDAGCSHEWGGAHPRPRSAPESGEALGYGEKRTSVNSADDGASRGFPGASCASGASFPNKTILDGERI